MNKWLRHAVMLFLAVFLSSLVPSYNLKKAYASPEVLKVRLWGSDRFQTACAISQEGWQSSKYAILTNSEGNNAFTDALAGSTLSALFDAPVLLTNTDELNMDTLKELQRLKATSIYILGGSSIISDNIKNELEREGLTVERIWGNNRYETAVKIGSEIRKAKTFEKVILTTGSHFQYALMVSPFASKQNLPILFTESDALPPSTKKALKDWGIKEVEVIGNSTVVSDAVTNELKKLGINTLRIGGLDMQETNINVVKNYGPTWDSIAFTRDDLYADSLSGGPFAAKKNIPIFLIGQNKVSSEISDYITGKRINSAYVFGGPNAISYDVVNALIPFSGPSSKDFHMGNTYGNIINNGATAISGDWIYFTHMDDSQKIYKSKFDGTNITKISDLSASGINIFEDWIYYINESDKGKLYKMKLDGTDDGKISDDTSYSINAAGEWIYYINCSDNKNIYRIKTDGTGRMKICNDECSFLNVCGEWIFYCNYNDESRIYKINVNGSSKEKLCEDRSANININSEWIYYSNMDDDSKIYRMRTDGSGRSRITSDTAYSINVSDEWIYYTNGNKSSFLYRIKTDGSQKINLNFDVSSFINVAGNWIYYFNENSQEFYKINLDGTNRQIVFVKSAAPLVVPML